MIKQIRDSIEDFIRGYSIQKNAVEELMRRKEYLDRSERSYNIFVVYGYIQSVNAVHREVERMRDTPFENRGRGLYRILHKRLWEEALSEMTEKRRPVRWIG